MDTDRGPAVHDVRRFYSEVDDVWSNDPWHTHSRRKIIEGVRDLLVPVLEDRWLLANVGSAGQTLGIDVGLQFHSDIVLKRLPRGRSVVANTESLPWADNSFDAVIAVGSVLNYCDATQAVFELCRILRPRGWLLLEFEVSGSAEFLFSKAFRSHAAPVLTFMGDHQERVWVFSEAYVETLLKASNMAIAARRRFHLVSPIVYFLTRSPQIAGWAGQLDGIAARLVPKLKLHGHTMLLGQKQP